MPDSTNPGCESTSPRAKPKPSQRPTAAQNNSRAPDTAATRPPDENYPVHWRRYRRTLRFAAWLFMRVLFWELLLRRVLGEIVIGRGRPARLRRWAREFRGLATEMGGVMIKLGQFISSRIDVLPPEITDELSSLQDEVPSVPFAQICQTIVEDLGDPDEHFSVLEQDPVAAASLGQAHRARLHSGQRVIVKIQRPGIRTLVHTDLKALGVVARWAMALPFIARRANVPALLDEFSAVMWQELDYEQERQHAARFRDMFADDWGIYIPDAYDAHSTRRVLTLEDVTAIKITDYDAITAAGVDRRDVARRLVNTSLRMVFVERFFHADPHPGNLFVYPLPADSAPPTGRHAGGQPLYGRPFYLVFVDFGMVGQLTPTIVAGLRETLAALVTRDARRLVRSYQQLGVLLPGADLERIETATRAAFDRVWGMNLDEINRMQFNEMAALGREFSDLLFELPFQVPQDFLYLGRAVGILVGMATGLDPQYDPWREIQPFAIQLLVSNGEFPTLNPLSGSFRPRDFLKPEIARALLSEEGASQLLNTGFDVARRAVQIPLLAETALRRAERGELTVQTAPTKELERQIRRLEAVGTRLMYAVLAGTLAISGAIIFASGSTLFAWILFALAALALVRAILSGGIR